MFLIINKNTYTKIRI